MATWGEHSVDVYACGGAFGPMTSAGPVGTAGAMPQIVLQVGQQLRISRAGDWSGYTMSAPESDTPSVLRVDEGAEDKLVGVYTAVSPGFADIGARSNLCAPAVCFLAEVQVTAP